MNELLFLLLTMASLCFCSFAQSPAASQMPDLSGTWEIEKGMGSFYKNRVLVIKQEADRMIMIETFEFEGKQFSHNLTLYPDRRGEKNRIVFPDNKVEVEVQSTTFWKGGKLIRKSIYDIPIRLMANQGFSIRKEDRDSYSLDENGTRLVLESSSVMVNAPVGPSISNIKRIYRKKT
jgi:hypothetical protein